MEKNCQYDIVLDEEPVQRIANCSRTNHVEGWHHRLSNVVHSYFYLFIRSIQNDDAYNLAISLHHLATGR